MKREKQFEEMDHSSVVSTGNALSWIFVAYMTRNRIDKEFNRTRH